VKYLFLICPDPTAPQPAPGENASPQAWVDEMDGRGVRLIGDRLRPEADATQVRVREGETVLTEGPYVETKDLIGGFDVIDCKDLDEAVEIAAKHPMARYGVVDVRPFWPLGL
jgi:hypothetical protein